jgi:putative NIF3 family GTP cyclohydrolase 1 type 2
MAIELTGWGVDQILNSALGYQMSTAMWEGFCAGDMHTPVRGVAVCYAPTVEVLRRAAAEKRNLILTREHPFFMHGGLTYLYTTQGLEAALKDDAVVKAKRDLIEANQLIVYRMSTAWDNFMPQAQSTALAKAMGMTPIAPQPNPRSRGVVCDCPPTVLQALAQTAVDKLNTATPRVVGDPKATFTRVAVLAGETDPKKGLAALLADPKIDGIIAGAGGMIDEVDGGIAWFQDLVSSGRKISMLAVGYGPSEEPGTAEMAGWLHTVLPSLTIEWWPAHDISWIPR